MSERPSDRRAGTARSHYDVLGVSVHAGADEVRRAYLERAREAHPDRHIDAGSAQRTSNGRRMQEVNEAWRVLGNPRRRRRYDLERSPQDRFISRSDGTMPTDGFARARSARDGDGDLDLDFDLDLDELTELDGTTRLLRALPWMILVFVLFAIFIFTAYAATGGGKATPLPSNNLGRCVTVAVAPQLTVASAACNAPGARLVVAEVDTNQQCPLGSERLQPLSGPTVYCLEV